MARVVSQLEGVDLTIGTLGRFKSAIQRRILRSALTKAARVLAKEAKKLAPKDSGLLKKSIGYVVRTYKDGRLTAVIGPRRGFKQMVTRTKRFPVKSGTSAFAASDIQVTEMADPVNYAHLVEYGTEPHSIAGGDDRLNKSGVAGRQIGATHPGAKARPFMRPAYDRKKGEAESVFRQGVADGLIRERIKAGKK